MEVVSATKMRRSQEFALRARPYALASLEILKNLLSHTTSIPQLLRSRSIKNSLLLVITSDKGLAGAFNTGVLKLAEEWIKNHRSSPASTQLITVGKKSRDYFKSRGTEVQENFINFGDFSAIEDTLPIADKIIQGFLYGTWDSVEAVYTNFITTLKQEALLRRILPVTPAGIEEVIKGILPEKGKYAVNAAISPRLSASSYNYEYKFEPSPEEILNFLVPQLIRMHIHHIILESNASEHSARMVAMKNASENAGELMNELTLLHNKARQAGITREIVEITAGKEALETF